MGANNSSLLIGVIGGGVCKTKTIEKAAYEAGKEIARNGYILVCGGMGGVMKAACRAAKEYGGTTVGILPGKNKFESNPYLDIPIVTAMSHARNAIIVRSSDAIIAIDGAYGTLSEIALAKVLDKPVYGIMTWNIKNVKKVKNAVEALNEIKKKIGSKEGRTEWI